MGDNIHGMKSITDKLQVRYNPGLKQNNGDLWVNLFGGFDGYLSKLRYYDEALEYEEIQGIVKEGPSKIITADTGELPPYLDNDWWKN